MRSVDKASRREPPIVTASRMGQTDCVKLFLECLPELDIERKDGQGRTALWHAVQEQKDDVVALLVEAGARLYYEGTNLEYSNILNIFLKYPRTTYICLASKLIFIIQVIMICRALFNLLADVRWQQLWGVRLPNILSDMEQT